MYERFPTSGLVVELEPSGCIVIREERTTGRDVVLTVTDVRGLCNALETALIMRDAYEETSRG